MNDILRQNTGSRGQKDDRRAFNSSLSYSPAELMVSVAAGEIQDNELVFVGMRLPLLAFIVAKKIHAPNAIGLFENGVLREIPATGPIVTMGDPPNIHRATQCSDMMTIMGFLQRGLVDVGFIGGAEVDRYGNLNTSRIPRSNGFIGLPGSGGGGDIASLAQRLLIIMSHEKRRFVKKVDYITSPGYGLGGRWRMDQGLVRGGPSAIITTLGIFRFHPHTKEAFLAQVHPGVSINQVKDETGWDLKIALEPTQTLPPTAQTLSIIRQYDPQGFWTG
jgi:glutaconate CoA-transferase, subunit B